MKRSFVRILKLLGVLWSALLILDLFEYAFTGRLPEWREWVTMVAFTGVMLFTTWFSETALWNQTVKPTWPERWLIDVLVIVGVLAVFFVSDLIAGNMTNVPFTFGRVVTLSLAVVESVIVRRKTRRFRARRRRMAEIEAKLADDFKRLNAEEADAADLPENIQVLLADGRVIAVECVYAYTDSDGTRVWHVVTPLPDLPIGIRGKVPLGTTVRAPLR